MPCKRALPIQQEYVRLPADLAHWNARLAQATDESLHAEHREEVLEARVKIEFKMKVEKISVEQLAAHVASDSRVIEARLDHIRAEIDRIKIKGVCDAIQAKRDMLISLGAHIRAEVQANPRLNTR